MDRRPNDHHPPSQWTSLSSALPNTARELRDRIVPVELRVRRIPTKPPAVHRQTTAERELDKGPAWQHINAVEGTNFTNRSARLIQFQAHIFVFLNDQEASKLEIAFPYLDRLYGDTRLSPPGRHLRRQRHGFGRDTDKVSSTHSTPSPYLRIHYAWDFLSPSDRRSAGEASPYIEAYAHMRQKSASVSISHVRAERPSASPEDLLSPIDKNRAYCLAIALMRFNFVYAHLIRWLGGTYTYEHRDFDAVFDLVDRARDHAVPAGFPPVDYERAFMMFTRGAPVSQHYQCSFESLESREKYDNHAPLSEVEDQVRTKFNKEERLSYYVMFPRSIWAFIPGLGISPLTFIGPKTPGAEGRICLDPTSVLPATFEFPIKNSGKEPGEEPGRRTARPDDGAPNSQIPNTGTPGKEDTNPKVYYATVLLRMLTWVWRMRIQHPDLDILLSLDDIAAAFHRILYHPALAPGFAMVFCEFLAIATGLVFGAKNSPSIYMIPAELRAHISAIMLELDSFLGVLAESVKLPPPLTLQETAQIQQATSDGCHQALSVSGGGRPPVFVDDTGIVGIPKDIRQVINRSVLASYIIFGFPAESNSPAVINPSKFQVEISHSLLFLGLTIDSRAMTVEWPKHKRLELARMLEEHWLNKVTPASSPLTPAIASRPLGLIRSAALITPAGVYLSLRLQFQLNDMLRRDQQQLSIAPKKPKRAPQKKGTSRWWRTSPMARNPEVCAELAILHKWLTQPRFERIWKRPIGLMVDRTPTVITEGDASYQGLGGLGASLNFMWRLSRTDMIDIGVPMKTENQPPEDDAGTHINMLEFMALLISVYFALALSPPNSQPVIYATGDNTSALSWMAYAARTKRPIVRRLARLMQCLLTCYPYYFAIQNEHVKGIDNETADALSRFKIAPTWRAAIEVTSPKLDNCQPYQVPSELLIMLQKIVFSEQPGEWYVTKMTELWTVKPVTLPPGWLQVDTMTSLSPTWKKAKSSQP